MRHLPARPWLLALLTLGVALLPVFLAWRDYRDEARRKDAQLFDATSGLVTERLHLLTVRHLNLFNILRNQVRAQPTREALRVPPNLRESFPPARLRLRDDGGKSCRPAMDRRRGAR